MIRKTLFLAALLLSVLGSAAQQAVGEWTMFPSLSNSITDVVETPAMVYYTSGNRLFSYDKESNETYCYNTINKLSDTNVQFIQYNPEGKYLFVAYDNSNIDLIYDNGRVVNLADIVTSTISGSRTINSVNFVDGRIYLGTDFGLVIYDDDRHEVVESGIYNLPILSATRLGDYLLILRKTDNIALMSAPIDTHHNTLDKFTLISGLGANWIAAFGNKILYYDTFDKKIRVITCNPTATSVGIVSNDLTDINATGQPVACKDGYYFNCSDRYVYLDNDGSVSHTMDIPDQLAAQHTASWNGSRSIWGGDSEGLANYDISGPTVTVLADKTNPNGVITDMVFVQKFDKLGRLYTGNIGATRFRGGYSGDYTWFPQLMTRLNTDGTFENVGAVPASASEATTIAEQRLRPGDLRMYGGCTRFVIDPQLPDRYYQGNNLEGVYVVENGKELHKFNWTNSPMIGAWGSSCWDVNFDPDGNLWVGFWVRSNQQSTLSPYWVLPKDKLYGDLSKLTIDDWQPSKHFGHTVGEKDMGSLMCSKSPVMLTWNSVYRSSIGVTLTKGTWANTADDEYFELTNPLDQDGKTFVPDRFVCAVEDQRGRVWIGSSSGLVEITNPASLSPNSRVSRIKVPRNDGTNYADYLCETDLINDIAVDASNRKWIATDASGVFLVSENGDEIIENFTTSNSPLPSNTVLSVSCDPNSNTVYFGLKTGLMAYKADSSPAAEDFSNVYAYPNPVRPDYTGYITITNLMDDSLVKITDAMGNVVFQTRSEGGMAIWDGLDANHNRVKSGVYLVFASQNANGSSSGAVTKILVVR